MPYCAFNSNRIDSKISFVLPFCVRHERREIGSWLSNSLLLCPAGLSAAVESIGRAPSFFLSVFGTRIDRLGVSLSKLQLACPTSNRLSKETRITTLAPPLPVRLIPSRGGSNDKQ